MIPAIGIMIGFYTITRMLDLASKDNSSTTLKAIASIAIIVNGLITAGLVIYKPDLGF